jgi:hypothetical protein
VDDHGVLDRRVRESGVHGALDVGKAEAEHDRHRLAGLVPLLRPVDQPLAAAVHRIAAADLAVRRGIVVHVAGDYVARVFGDRVLDPEHDLLAEAARPVDDELAHAAAR